MVDLSSVSFSYIQSVLYCADMICTLILCTDPSLTSENIFEVVKDLDVSLFAARDGVYRLFKACGVVIKYTGDFQREKEREAMIKNYVTWHPLRSWKNLISGLREVGQHELAESVSSKYTHGMFLEIIILASLSLTSSFCHLYNYYFQL